MINDIPSKKCVICGNTFYNVRSNGKGRKWTKKQWEEQAKYCSPQCNTVGKLGNKNRYKPELHSNKKVLCNCGCGQYIPEYDDHGRLRKFINGHQRIGIPRPDMVEIMKNNQRTFSGNKHWNWKNGITPELHKLRQSDEYRNWRNEVYKRDHYTCQHCKSKCTAKMIVAHHIKFFKDYPELRYEVSNGITLCRSCHKKLHKEIGEDTQFKKVKL